jgi:hypothetical protein
MQKDSGRRSFLEKIILALSFPSLFLILFCKKELFLFFLLLFSFFPFFLYLSSGRLPTATGKSMRTVMLAATVTYRL